MTKKEHEEWKKTFWETRTQGNPEIWNLLRMVCDMSPDEGYAYINAAGL